MSGTHTPGPPPGSYRRHNLPVILVVALVTGTLGAMAALPTATPEETRTLASRFRMDVQTLPDVPVPAGGVEHPVNQTARHMQFYFYQVGESVALGDLDGDGLPNDLCRTDVKSKALEIRPVPGTGDRYAPFVVDFGPRVDRRTVHPSVCRLADINEDGLTDVLVAFYGRAPLLLLRQPADGPAPLTQGLYATEELIPSGQAERWWTATAAFSDVDGDGHQDLIVGNYYPDGAEITNPDSAVPFEMNADFSRARNGGLNRIFLHTSGPQRYTDAGNVFPGDGARAWTLAIGAADLNRDGLSELYIANDFGPDQLLLNESTPGSVKLRELTGRQSAATPESAVMGLDSFKGMSADFGDINGDGAFDISVSNIGSPFALGESHFLWESTGQAAEMREGRAPYIERGLERGVAHSAWGWDTRFEDFDNDGTLELVQATGLVKGRDNKWPDLAQVGASNDTFVRYQSSWPKFLEGAEVDGSFPNPFWVRGAGDRYVDVSTEVFPGLTPATRGIAVGDVDGDGRVDMAFANFWESSQFIRNASEPGAFLGLHLLLPAADAPSDAGLIVHDGHPRWREGVPAVGAMVEITPAGAPAQMRQVDGGNGHSGQRSAEVRFGLGRSAPGAVPVRITWRDWNGKMRHQTLTLTPGYHTVVLGESGETR